MNALRRWLRLAGMYAFQVGFVRPMLRWFWGVHFRRRRNVPEGPCIVVANHNSHIDTAVLMSIFPLRRLPHVHPVAAADYFGQNAIRSAAAMIGMNAMAIERTAAPGRDVLQPMIEALQAGESLIFFPEGSRGEPGVVAPFRSGIGKIVKSIPGLPVLPVFVSGAERSLPRGESVPLPLGIDVIIGKPRTYSDQLEAREIAEQVRDDVLALAPPPPPVPGPRPAPPTRVAVCGIDAEANCRLFEKVTVRCGAVGRTIGIGETVVESDGGPLRRADRIATIRSSALPRALAWAFRTGGLFRGNKFAVMVERARVEEALQGGRAARFVTSLGSPLVDLLAWAEADFYSGQFDEKGLQRILLYLSGQRRVPVDEWPRFVKKAPEVWLLNVFDLAQPPAPDVLVLVTAGPAETIARVRASGRALEPWENEAFLGRLQEAYRQVAAVLRKRRIEVIELADAESAAESAIDAIDAVARRASPKGQEGAAAG